MTRHPPACPTGAPAGRSGRWPGRRERRRAAPVAAASRGWPRGRGRRAAAGSRSRARSAVATGKASAMREPAAGSASEADSPSRCWCPVRCSAEACTATDGVLDVGKVGRPAAARDARARVPPRARTARRAPGPPAGRRSVGHWPTRFCPHTRSTVRTPPAAGEARNATALGDVHGLPTLLQRVQPTGHLPRDGRDVRGHLGLDEARGARALCGPAVRSSSGAVARTMPITPPLDAA